MKNQKNSETKKLENVNVSKIEENVKADKKEKSAKVERTNVYAFDYKNLSTDDLKKKRQNARNKLSSFTKNIINYSDFQKDNEKLGEEIKNFTSFYKEIYLLNDFSVKSVRNKVDEKEKRDLERMFQIIQENKIEKTEKKKEKIKA